MFIRRCTLYIPCVTDEFVLITDACACGVGSVLCVVHSGCFLPVAFYSRQLSLAM